MDVNSKRVKTITGQTIEEVTEKLNAFLGDCEIRGVVVHETEFHNDRSPHGETEHFYLVRHDHYSESEKYAHHHAEALKRMNERRNT